MKRLVLPGLAIVAVVVGIAGQHLWAAMEGRPPLITHLKLALMPVLPWSKTTTPPFVDVSLPWGFADRGPDAARTTSERAHLPFGFGSYRSENPLGGTHHALQVDVVVVGDDASSLRGWFFSSAGFVAIGGAVPDRTEELANDVVVEHWLRRADLHGTDLRAVVVVDTRRLLRLEVIDELVGFSETALRAFALDVFASIAVNQPVPTT